MSFIEKALQHFTPETSSKETAAQSSPSKLAAQSVAANIDEPSSELTRPVHDSMPFRSDGMLAVDYSVLRSEGLVAPEEEEGRMAEEYRLIKRPLIRSMMAADAAPLANIVMVTSAVPGEGKTFTAVNLALSLARERNREVLLVDGDVIKRHITHLFQLEEQPGLLDAVGVKGAGLGDSILRTNISSLYVLPAGNMHADATEILRSERAIELLASLASSPRRIVLIDSPPLLATSVAGVLTLLAGQVVVVVKASDTAQDVVLRAIETVPDDKSLSLVLTQVLSVSEHGYGYDGYHARYGYGAHALRQGDNLDESVTEK